MAMSNDSLDRLHRDLGFQRLSHWWGRAEMFLGLLAMAASAFGMLYLAVDVIQLRIRLGVPADAEPFPLWPAIGAVFLFALGGYLALAGHRRHLYESNDRLTAYLADLIRTGGGTPAVIPPDRSPPNGPVAPVGERPTAGALP